MKLLSKNKLITAEIDSTREAAYSDILTGLAVIGIISQLSP
jgi:hypothetical protein